MDTLSHVADIERSLGILFYGMQTEERDFDETAHGYGDDIRYTAKYFTRYTFNATGFQMVRDGVIISGDFPQPLQVAMVEVDDDGGDLNTEFGEAIVARAVLAKLGGIPDVEGGLRAAAGV